MKPLRVFKPDEIPEGAIQIHLYNYKDVLRPRGHMKKESIGIYILERLKTYYESWTDEKYGDNPPRENLMNQLRSNLDDEMAGAWREFLEWITQKGKESVKEDGKSR